MLKKLSLVYNLQLSRKYPVSLVHFVTNRCNARCSFCFIDFDNPKTFKNELTLTEIDKITRNIGPNLTNVNLEMQYSESSWGVYITSIGWYEPTGNSYWSLYHNGVESMVGIGDLELENDSVIVWQVATW